MAYILDLTGSAQATMTPQVAILRQSGPKRMFRVVDADAIGQRAC